MTEPHLTWVLGIVGIVAALLLFAISEARAERRKKESLKAYSESPSRVTKYTWEQFEEGAKQAGSFILTEYKPDAILIFSGPSSIFSSLVLHLALDREALLTQRIFTGRFISKSAHADPTILRGFEILDSELARMRILIPEAFRSGGNRNWKVAIIDDTTTTGMSMELVKRHLHALGYTQIKTACFTCIGRENYNVDDPIDYAYEHTKSNDYLFPWGKKPL